MHLIYALRELAFCYQDCLEQSMDPLCLCKIEIVLFVFSITLHYLNTTSLMKRILLVSPTEKMQVFWLWHVLEVEEWCKSLPDLWFSFQFLVSWWNIICLYFEISTLPYPSTFSSLLTSVHFLLLCRKIWSSFCLYPTSHYCCPVLLVLCLCWYVWFFKTYATCIYTIWFMTPTRNIR